MRGSIRIGVAVIAICMFAALSVGRTAQAQTRQPGEDVPSGAAKKAPLKVAPVPKKPMPNKPEPCCLQDDIAPRGNVIERLIPGQ
jgi:hypothetical protein